MTVIRWRTKGLSCYGDIDNQINIAEKDVEAGVAPATLAHEIAHKQSGILSNWQTDTVAELWWKELWVWEHAFKTGLSPDEVSEDFFDDILGAYLEEDLKGFYGEESFQYRKAKEGYEQFKRRYLR